jgi:molybdopterin-binding protein
MATIEIEGLGKRYGDTEVLHGVDLRVEEGEFVTLLGPSGCGKTTTLRCVAGLERFDAGTIRIGSERVASGGGGRFVAPERRNVGMVLQSYALWPHMTVFANVAYPLRMRRTPRREIARRVTEVLDAVGMASYVDRMPGQLSGGQAQRVALARALAARPRLLLLDEPLAALDQTTRAHVRHTLRTHLDGFGGVCLMVTHDPVEAVSLADRVLVLDEGRALQDAPPAEVTRHPRSPWVARMLGRNAWPGTATADGLALPGGGLLVVADPLPVGTEALAIIAPEAVAVHRDRPGGSPRNVWPGTVREITATGSRLRILIGSPQAPDLVAEITPQAAAELGLADGTSVWTSVKATEAVIVTL